MPEFAYGKRRASLCPRRTCCPLLGCIVCGRKSERRLTLALGVPKGLGHCLPPPLPSPPLNFPTHHVLPRLWALQGKKGTQMSPSTLDSACVGVGWGGEI